MTKPFSILIILVLCTFNLRAETEYQDNISYAPLPAWVEKTEYRDAAQGVSNDSSVSYLLVDNQMNFADGNHIDYFRLVQHINNKQGLTQASEVYFNFNPDYQELIIHAISIIRDGELIDQTEIELKTMKQESELSNRMLTGYVTALAILEDVQEGDLIDYAYSVSGSNPVFNNKKFAATNTSWLVDVDRAKVVVITDKENPLNHKVTGSPIKVTSSEKDNHIVYRWEAESIAAESSDQNVPNWYQRYDTVEFSEFDSWQEVAQWAVSLYDFDAGLNDELLTMNKQWKETSGSIEEYVKKVVYFVQNDIRYFGIELAENSHKPRHPNEVFSRRYGDCKDKALMISSLLAEHNIKASSALVSAYTHEGIQNRLPSPGAFDHVISKIELEDQIYWIDGTNIGQYGDLKDFTTNEFGLSLIIDDNSTILEDMSNAKVVTRKSHFKETFHSTGYDQPVTLEFNIEMTGGEAQQTRITVAQEGMELIEKNVLDYYQRQFSSSEWKTNLSIDDNKAINSLIMKGELTISDYWELQGTQRIIPLYGENISSYLSLPEQVNRTAPLANYENINVIHELTVKLHESISWDLESDNSRIATDHIDYRRSINTTPDSVSVVHSFQPVANHVEQKDMKSFVETIKKARDDLYYSVTISSVNTERIQLRNKMRSLLKL